MIKKLYPGGKDRAFSISYDDGVEQDIRLVDLLNRYGLKGTFNLNSGLMVQGFAWTHESGLIVRRLAPEVAAKLYEGHEVASHTFSHPYMDQLSESDVMKEMAADKYFLERLMGMEVCGFAVPFTYYSDMIARCAEKCGFHYARISEETGNYSPGDDHYHWRGGKFHWDEDLLEYVEGFLSTDQELALCQLVGHSYDLDVMDSWEAIEEIFRMVSGRDDVAAMTNLEIIRYLQAMKMARITDGNIDNHSDQTLWFQVDGNVICLRSGESIERKDDRL